MVSNNYKVLSKIHKDNSKISNYKKFIENSGVNTCK